MQRHTSTEEQIRTQFISSLMEYFKIEENLNLRAHVADLVRDIRPAQYREFFRRLSLRPMPFKNGFEKIAHIAQEFEEETLTPIDKEAHERAEQLYRLMYDVRQQVVLARDAGQSAIERFEQIRFTSIRRTDSDVPLLDATDINVIRTLTKRWIYDYVSLDRGLFDARVIHEYRTEIIRREREKNTVLAAPLKAKLIGAGKRV
jgi:hypothetical protein